MAQSRSQRTDARPARAHAGIRAAVTVLLAAAVVGTLWVPFYNSPTPTLGGFPFYYWYQLVWIPAVALLSWCAYLLTRRTERGEPATPPPAGTVPAPRPGQGEAN